MSESFKVKLVKREEGSGFKAFKFIESNNPESNDDNSGVSDESIVSRNKNDQDFELLWHDFVHDFHVFFQGFPFIKIFSEFHAISVIDMKLPKFLRENADLVVEDKNFLVFELQSERFRDFYNIAIQYTSASESSRLMANGFIMLLSSQFDVLVAKLIHTMIKKRPELLKKIKKEIEIENIFSVENLDELRSIVSEGVSESVIRKSRHEQIVWLENILEIPLRKDLPVYPNFIEINERRNLLTHTDGIVSSQYMKAAKEIGFHVSDGVEKGVRINISYEYYKTAANVFFEIGAKLIHVIWRKLCPGEIGKSDSALCNIVVDLERRERIDLAVEMSKFCCDVLKKYSGEQFRLMMLINYASSLNLKGDHEKKEEILRRDDWSARDIDFRLAAAAVKGDVDTVCGLMREIGVNKKFPVENYETWPVFFFVRKEKAFLECFESVFGRKFVEKISKTKIELDVLDEISRIKLDPINDDALDIEASD